MTADNAIQAEKKLAALIAAGDEDAVLAWLAGDDLQAIEFTGRCLSLAITSGMVRAACRMGEHGFHLCATDDAAAQRAIEQASSMRGLLDFLERYRYCKAQRSYYLPVVQSGSSIEPVRALLAAGLLSEADMRELLSLSLRMDNPRMARVLADGGAKLVGDIRDEVPAELGGFLPLKAREEEELWVEFATPQRSLETLELIFEHTGALPCAIHHGWWGSYGRQDAFAAKLALIACHSSAAHCDYTARLLETLAAEGEQAGLAVVLGWEALQTSWLDAALAAAQDAGKAQAAAAIMRAMKSADDTLDLLDF